MMFKYLTLMTAMLLTWQVQAVSITINNNKNEPMANAVVWLTSDVLSSQPSQADTLYSMVQKDREFTPRILVVPQNAKVEFPNADSILHHVYSFSEAKTFELKLYKEQSKAPLVFDQTGVVELGCNIHDWMLGYIVVVDSPIFAITDNSGHVNLSAEPGEYTLNVWHSGFGDISHVESKKVTIGQASFIYKVKQAITEQFDFATDEFDDY
ncbi:methylamine utilization protein [Pseudoalteromonas sp. S409]|nr:methylamine utilization protein [Pseudoalteromonas sp. S410]TMN87628.1 methylamine utilization protein [Pseudoalteromonas sp. S408]TMN95320.1 methylamine utilization protein [Pseudoalteromonas sp. S409]TMN96249.1 methylamine utilization protein [Pseudoalteromonas sp. S407]TMO06608.1 methylamine utilization protein [Pseudoalteromonas sp. S186]TMO14550.1 methylamine utilization protein [Pseudoalteromonas sp. S185]